MQIVQVNCGPPRFIRCLVTAAILVLVSYPVALPGQKKTEQPTADQIIQNLISRAHANEEQHADAHYTYTQRSVTDILDSKGAVKKHEVREYVAVPISGQLYLRQVSKDGKPLEGRDAKDERERERKFREKMQRPKDDRKDEGEVEFNEDLFDKYRFTLEGEEKLNGRTTFVLSFQPRSADLPIRRRIDRLLNELEGRLWVDEQDYDLAKLDAHLMTEVNAWGGLLATIRTFNLHYEQVRMADGTWLPQVAQGTIEGRIVFKWLNVRFDQRSGNYQKLGEVKAGSP
ncbi:MAG: hypothetical protein ACRD4K_07545 [Candidatus Acidiferrales bacterium]